MPYGMLVCACGSITQRRSGYQIRCNRCAKEASLASKRRWHAKNIDSLRKKKRERRAANPEPERAQKNRWAAANRLKTKEYNRTYGEKHPSANADRKRRRYAEIPEYIQSEWRKHARLRRAKDRRDLIGTAVIMVSHALS